MPLLFEMEGKNHQIVVNNVSATRGELARCPGLGVPTLLAGIASHTYYGVFVKEKLHKKGRLCVLVLTKF